MEKVGTSTTGDGHAAGQGAGVADMGSGWRRDSYSPAKRVYLDHLEQGAYNAYAGGTLFAPLLARHSFPPTLRRVIMIPTHEGYSLEELGLTLFYLHVAVSDRFFVGGSAAKDPELIEQAKRIGEQAAVSQERLDRIVQLICRRWGEENAIKELLRKYVINYTRDYVLEENC